MKEQEEQHKDQENERTLVENVSQRDENPANQTTTIRQLQANNSLNSSEIIDDRFQKISKKRNFKNI